MCNRHGIWASQPRNMEFQSVLATNWHFPLKCKHLWILSGNFKKIKCTKTCVTDYYVYPIRNIGLTAGKYGVSDNFCRKLAFLGKTQG
jgi:hypothetical protein